MLNFAVEQGYIKQNKLLGKIKKLKENESRWTYLKPHEVEKLKKYLSKTYHDIFDFLIYTGLRLGEALSLKKKDIDLENGIIWIKENKTGYTHTIPINSKVREVLRKRIKNLSDNDRVFQHSDSEFRRNFKKALKTAGLDTKIRIHDLRHTFASWLAMSGTDIQQIAALLGHKQITTTLRYAHLNIRTMAEASEKVVNFARKKKDA
jgi:integrase